MINVHDPDENDNKIEFVGIVGKAGSRQTTHGLAIDVADNTVRPCRWVDVVPDNPAMIVDLVCGDVVRVIGEVLQTGSRRLVSGNVAILRNQHRGMRS